MTSIKSAKFIRCGGKGFTIVELLTVMSIIIIIMSVLVPALSRTRRFAKTVTQKAQFYEIDKALREYHDSHDYTYPDSGPADSATPPVGYCGAMKLCEALIGQDGMGLHPSSRFLADATTSGPGGTDIYLFDLCTKIAPGDYDTIPGLRANLRERTKYLDTEKIKAARLQDLYTWQVSDGVSYKAPTVAFNATPDTHPNPVICDVFTRATIAGTCPERSGEKVGMPVLYYKANPSKLSHDVTTPDNPDNIYDFDDNYAITALGCPWEATKDVVKHPLFDDDNAATPTGQLFYELTLNTKVTATPRPHNEETYILISAGWDGLYGTRDDVFNFSD